MNQPEQETIGNAADTVNKKKKQESFDRLIKSKVIAQAKEKEALLERVQKSLLNCEQGSLVDKCHIKEVIQYEIYQLTQPTPKTDASQP